MATLRHKFMVHLTQSLSSQWVGHTADRSVSTSCQVDVGPQTDSSLSTRGHHLLGIVPNVSMSYVTYNPRVPNKNQIAIVVS